MKKKLIRITTVPTSLKILLKDQLNYMNHHFDVIAVSSPNKELQEVAIQEGVRTKAINMTRKITPIKDILSLFKMIRFFLKEKPKIVHTHTPKAGIIGMLAAWFCQIPTRLHTIAGLPVMESTGYKKKLLLIIEKLTYACSTHVYPNSNGLKEYILNNNLTKKNKLSIIGHGSSNGINTNYFKRNDDIIAQSDKIKTQLNLENKFIFCFVGRIVKDKGINELLSAFEDLSETNTNIALLLVGPFEKNLDPISEESHQILETNRNIIHLGFQNDTRPYLALSNFIVLPTYREGFPNVLLQASAMGTPSITTDINGCNEIIINKYNGFIIPPKDKQSLFNCMKRVIADPSIEKKLRKVCRQNIISKFDQNKFHQLLLKEYQLHLKK